MPTKVLEVIQERRNGEVPVAAVWLNESTQEYVVQAIPWLGVYTRPNECGLMRIDEPLTKILGGVAREAARHPFRILVKALEAFPEYTQLLESINRAVLGGVIEVDYGTVTVPWDYTRDQILDGGGMLSLLYYTNRASQSHIVDLITVAETAKLSQIFKTLRCLNQIIQSPEVYKPSSGLEEGFPGVYSTPEEGMMVRLWAEHPGVPVKDLLLPSVVEYLHQFSWFEPKEKNEQSD